MLVVDCRMFSTRPLKPTALRPLILAGWQCRVRASACGFVVQRTSINPKTEVVQAQRVAGQAQGGEPDSREGDSGRRRGCQLSDVPHSQAVRRNAVRGQTGDPGIAAHGCSPCSTGSGQLLAFLLPRRMVRQAAETQAGIKRIPSRMPDSLDGHCCSAEELFGLFSCQP